MLCRVSQFHISRMPDYGMELYQVLLQLVAFGSTIVSHCCAKTCLVVATMVQFLNTFRAEKMTTALLESLNNVDSASSKLDAFRSVVFRCALASVMANVPMQRDEQIP